MAVPRGCQISCGRKHAWSGIAFFSRQGGRVRAGNCMTDPQTTYKMVFSVKLTNIKL
jgi:hypothetical protein